MRVRMRFIGALAWRAGRDELVLELPEGSTVLSALRKACEELPELSSVLFNADTGDPRTNFLILLNRKDVDVLGGLSAELADGDELSIVPLMRL